MFKTIQFHSMVPLMKTLKDFLRQCFFFNQKKISLLKKSLSWVTLYKKNVITKRNENEISTIS